MTEIYKRQKTYKRIAMKQTDLFGDINISVP
jgi:hypothetical protein